MKDSIKVTGRVQITTVNSAGKVLDVRDIPNMVVDVGLVYIIRSMVKTSNSPAAMTHMAAGTGTTPTTGGDTVLAAEICRVALTASAPSGTSMVFSATIPAGTGTGVLSELGIFNDALAGTMLCRTVFPSLPKPADAATVIAWTITLSRPEI